MTFVLIVLSGLLASVVMYAVLMLIKRLELANADMVRALGSLFTRDYESSLLPGLIIHFGSGILFGFIYFSIMSYFVTPTILYGPVVGFAMGFFHGMVVSLGLVIIVAEHHPLERFREAGFSVASAHLVAHIFYGVSIGVMYGILGIRIL